MSSTTVSPTIPDTWENRIEQAANVMGLTPERVEQILATKGYEITKEPCGLQMLSDEEVTPFGDLRKLFCEENDVAVPKLRMAIRFLRGPKDSPKTTEIDTEMVALQSKYGFRMRMEDLGIEELLPYYKPTKKNRIYETLVKKFGSKPVIAFKPDSTEVAIEETCNYIADIENGLPEEESIEVDGELVKLYSVGKIPNQVVDEDPLFEGQPLKRGRSVVNRFNWTNVELEVRQFFRILVDRNDVNSNDRINLTKLIYNSLKELKELFPEAYQQYKELKAKGDLPKLVLSLDESTAKRNDPFSINRRY
jgi:hypothetical protein